MNKKFFLLSVPISLILAFIAIKLILLTGFDHQIRELVATIETDKNSEFKYKVSMSLSILAFLSVNSFICFKLAKTKGLDPKKWARKGFLYSIYAIAYLLFFTEQQKTNKRTTK